MSDPTFGELLLVPWAKDAMVAKTYTLVRPTLGSYTGTGTDADSDPFVDTLTITI